MKFNYISTVLDMSLVYFSIEYQRRLSHHSKETGRLAEFIGFHHLSFSNVSYLQASSAYFIVSFTVFVML